MPEDRLVPFRWPREWTNPSLVRLCARSAVNCLVMETPAGGTVAAARAAGLAVLDWSSLGAAPVAETRWTSPAARTTITGLVWPRIKLSPAGRPDEVAAAPTGAPWIDSNSWVARLAKVRAPGKPLWLDFAPADDAEPGETAYQVAIADAAANGARWIVQLDPRLRGRLAAGDAGAAKTWQGILATLGFFEKHRPWTGCEPRGSVGILSSFEGKHEFMAQEALNLAARRNLLYTVLDRLQPPEAQKLDGLPAVLYVDEEAPSAAWKARLARFASDGGMLIAPHALAASFSAAAAGPCAVAGYEVRPLGKGRVAAPVREWDDPYFLAADVHSLVSRRRDPVRLFNGRSLWQHYGESADGTRAVLQLVGFTGQQHDSVSLTAAREWRSASMRAPGWDRPVELKPVRVDGQMEYRLPRFPFYAALEFRG